MGEADCRTAKVSLAVPSNLPAAVMAGAARYAESRGVYAVFVVEGIGRDAASQVAFLAAHTTSIRLGTSVIPVLTKTPGLVAMIAASLDEMAQGRLLLGLGTGGPPTLAPHGIGPVRNSLDQMRDYVGIVRAALLKQGGTYEGAHHRIVGLDLWLEPARRDVPIFLAALGPQMTALAGEISQGPIFNMISPADVGDFARLAASGRARARRSAARPELGCMIACSMAQSADVARRNADKRITYYGTQANYQQMWQRNGLDDDAGRMMAVFSEQGHEAATDYVTSRMRAAVPVAAGPDELEEKLTSYLGAGITMPIVYPSIEAGATAGVELRAAVDVIAAV